MTEEQEGTASPEDQDEKPPVPSDEVIRSYKVHAVYANKMLASNLPNGMRIAFAEAQLPAIEPEYRVAVFMSYEDAESLAQLIQSQLSRLQRVTIQVGPDGKATPVTE